MLRIHIDSITEKGLDLDERVDASRLPLLNAVSQEEALRFNRPVHVRVHAAVAGETVLIDGSATSRVHINCSRCLAPFDLPIQSDFSATAVAELPAPPPTETADETELSVDDMDLIAYTGNSIDLRKEIAQQLIMALPFNPLCSQACKGLCSCCGVNLNQAPCRCAKEEKSNPFAVLKTLSFPESQE